MPLDQQAELGEVAAGYQGADGWFQRYTPRSRWLENGHVQTLAGNFWPRKHDLPKPESEIIEVEPAKEALPASRVLCHCHWQPAEVRAKRLTVLLVHGLEGSSDSHYIRGNAAKAWRAGCNVVRMNMRNCGNTELLCPTLYHCGLSDDVKKVIDHFVGLHGLESVAAVGYSMGGNLVLKYVGELGANPPAYLKAAVGISPAMDLGLCADALHHWQNRLYESNFLKGLLRRYRYKAGLFPNLFDVKSAEAVRSIRDFDTHIVARYCGFRDADDYYAKTQSSAVASKIRVPTLVIHALDDPFIRMSDATRDTLRANPNVRLIESDHGGHCAFLSRTAGEAGPEDFDGYWAEHTLLQFLLTTVGEHQSAAPDAFSDTRAFS
jgi:predicted alpha/beta-fold hydrolase